MYKSKATVPAGVFLIRSFYAFGAIVLLAFLFINPAEPSSMIAERHGLPAITLKFAKMAWKGTGSKLPRLENRAGLVFTGSIR